MALRLVGAGLGRTGTNSLKLAIELLTGGRCYHMTELFERPGDTAVWREAVVDRRMPDWRAFLAEFDATVDWPACAFWREIADAFPDAPVLLSTRSSAESWWNSIEQTIVQVLATEPTDAEWAERRAMVQPMLLRFCPGWPERGAMIAAYEEHNDEVRRMIPAGRLVEWRPGDGWEPLCEALGVAVPDEPFPHTNTSEEFRAAMELENDAPN